MGAHYCSQCGAKLPETGRFCSSCGRAVAVSTDEPNGTSPAGATAVNATQAPESLHTTNEMSPPRYSVANFLLVAVVAVLAVALVWLLVGGDSVGTLSSLFGGAHSPIGVWSDSPEGVEAIDFRGDGTVYGADSASGWQYVGSWRMDGGRVVDVRVLSPMFLLPTGADGFVLELERKDRMRLVSVADAEAGQEEAFYFYKVGDSVSEAASSGAQPPGEAPPLTLEEIDGGGGLPPGLPEVPQGD